MEQVNTITRVFVTDSVERGYINFETGGKPYFTALERAHPFKTMEAANKFIDILLDNSPALLGRLKAETYKVSYSKLT